MCRLVKKMIWIKKKKELLKIIYFDQQVSAQIQKKRSKIKMYSIRSYQFYGQPQVEKNFIKL